MHTFPIRVYYEDTDLAGIVYYANYLRFIERARTEMLRAAGIDQSAVKSATGVVFAVRRVEADYIAPARFDEVLTVTTRVAALSGARATLNQAVLRGEETLFTASVTIVALTETGRPTRMPAHVRAALAGQGGTTGA